MRGNVFGNVLENQLSGARYAKDTHWTLLSKAFLVSLSCRVDSATSALPFLGTYHTLPQQGETGGSGKEGSMGYSKTAQLRLILNDFLLCLAIYTTKPVTWLNIYLWNQRKMDQSFILWEKKSVTKVHQSHLAEPLVFIHCPVDLLIMGRFENMAHLLISMLW